MALPTSPFQSNETDFELVVSRAVREYIPAALGPQVVVSYSSHRKQMWSLPFPFALRTVSSQRGLQVQKPEERWHRLLCPDTGVSS